MLFPTEVAEARDRINQRLAQYARLEGWDDGLGGGDCPERLRNAIRYSLLSPGKRMRPLLVLAANHLCGGDMDAAIPAACAVEMIHTYSLIHDDLPAMDDDDLRRGQPTCHIQFDEATAILAGDALISLAFEVLLRDTPTPAAVDCARWLAAASGARHLVGGQSDDLLAETLPPNLELLQKIHRRKTGALILVSLLMGARIADATAEQMARIREYGQEIGLAFQIVDDLLDLKGDVATMGKRVGKDDALGKLTYPRLMGIEASERLAREKAKAAIAAIEPFGTDAEPLSMFARYIVNRSI